MSYKERKLVQAIESLATTCNRSSLVRERLMAVYQATAVRRDALIADCSPKLWPAA